jgi:hypothetical protein
MSFLKEIFSECDGCASFGRVACGFTVVSTMAFIGTYLHWKHEFPTYDIILALSVLMTAPYGANKAAEAVSNVKDAITQIIVAKKTPAVIPTK